MGVIKIRNAIRLSACAVAVLTTVVIGLRTADLIEARNEAKRLEQTLRHELLTLSQTSEASVEAIRTCEQRFRLLKRLVAHPNEQVTKEMTSLAAQITSIVGSLQQDAARIRKLNQTLTNRLVGEQRSVLLAFFVGLPQKASLGQIVSDSVTIRENLSLQRGKLDSISQNLNLLAVSEIQKLKEQGSVMTEKIAQFFLEVDVHRKAHRTNVNKPLLNANLSTLAKLVACVNLLEQFDSIQKREIHLRDTP
ncbi:hypothetical protein IH992_14630 [Candidatus Poribacteria bacterium]|nr:hypothetical protein [Candidatus Poribacteria bacterium]